MAVPGPVAAASPFLPYRGPGGRFDELRGPDGALRPAWAPLVRALEALGPDGLDERWRQAQRLLRQNGVTYNVHNDPKGLDRPWQLDPVPLAIDAASWAAIEAALQQRARLLNAVLADLYGAQKLLKDGALPPSLVFAHPGFLLPSVGTPVPHGLHLHLLAVDLARAPDGTWWVLSHRAEAPSGAGYALENRVVVSRVLAEAARACGIRSPAPFFRALQETLRRLAPGADDPRVALLTPGPFNETFFEHAFLARYLGFTLVEGPDLAVRDGRLFLKTLEGLERIDVLWRRVDSDFTDPLELRADSTLGVAGLVDAARRGGVAVANALGSGFVETPALDPFLPGLCKHLLGEELRLPPVATWWCGQAREREHVIANLDKLVVKPAFRADRVQPVFGAGLDTARRDDLIARIRARPYRFVAQEQVRISAAPIWRSGVLEPRPIVLRAYVAPAADGWTVMPGGMARFAPAADDPVVSIQHGGGSKDVWVLAGEGAPEFGPHRPLAPSVGLRRTSPNLPSRVADGLFWLGRYAERTDAICRLLRTAVERLSEPLLATGREDMALLGRLLFQWGLGAQGALGDTPGRAARALFRSATDPGLADGLVATQRRLVQTASGVRDRLAPELWQIIAALESLAEAVPREDKRDLAALAVRLNDVTTASLALAGIEGEGMTRGPGWRFLDAGRRIERAVHALGHLRALLFAAPPEREAALDVLLDLAFSAMTYRTRYAAAPQRAPAVDLVLCDESNPRSVGFQLARLADHVEKLPRAGADEATGRANRLVLAALGAVRGADATALAADDAGLWDLLGRLAAGVPAVSNELAHLYFSHAVAPQPLHARAAEPASVPA